MIYLDIFPNYQIFFCRAAKYLKYFFYISKYFSILPNIFIKKYSTEIFCSFPDIFMLLHTHLVGVEGGAAAVVPGGGGGVPEDALHAAERARVT